MQLESAGLREQLLRKRGWSSHFVQYKAQQAACEFLENILKDDRSIGLLHGPGWSGKSTLIRRFVHGLPPDLAVAIVDGTGLGDTQLLSNMLSQFGYEVELKSTEELLNMVTVLVVQQTRTCHAPLLVLENISDMQPSALSALCKLAALTVGERFALRVILVSDHHVGRMLESPALSSIAERLIGDHELASLTPKETLTYLFAKLRACGVGRPNNIFPVGVCHRLFTASGGLPGKLDTIALSAMDRAKRFPVSLDDIVCPPDARQDGASDGRGKDAQREPVKLILTLNGKTLQQFRINTTKTLIGRSDLSDVFVNSRFVSKHHALLIRVQESILLVDLKSTNGTFVNSRQVESTVLRQNDIISLGNHRLKVVYPDNHQHINLDGIDTSDTATMQNIADARRMIAEKHGRRDSMTRREA